MNHTSSAPRRTRRSQSFVGLLLVLVYLVQPVFASLETRCGDGDCGAAAQCCCSGEMPGPAMHATPEKSCCGEQYQAPTAPQPESVSSRGCDCGADSAPVLPSEPMLVTDGKDVVIDTAFTRWVRAHAELSASVVAGPPVPQHTPGLPGGVAAPPPPNAVDTSAPDHSVVSVSAWALLVRGVQGLLAVLAAVRL